jgi:hypothetical protein
VSDQPTQEFPDGLRPVELSNARSVVKTWRTNAHTPYWGEAAVGCPPSELTTRACNAMAAVQRAADEQATALIAAGFLPGHANVMRLRTFASQAANEANRLMSWAAHLTYAEREQAHPENTATPGSPA